MIAEKTSNNILENKSEAFEMKQEKKLKMKMEEIYVYNLCLCS